MTSISFTITLAESANASQLFKAPVWMSQSAAQDVFISISGISSMSDHRLGSVIGQMQSSKE